MEELKVPLTYRQQLEEFWATWQPLEYNTVIIAHAGCPDGTASAWAFTHAVLELRAGRPVLGLRNNPLKLPIYIHFTTERNFFADKKMPSLTGKEVYVVDFSYPIETILYLLASDESRTKISRIIRIDPRAILRDHKPTKITVWDHHQTAEEDIFIAREAWMSSRGLREDEIAEMQHILLKFSYVIDKTRCGAEIVWDMLFQERIDEKWICDKKMTTRPWFIQHIRDRDLFLWEHPASKMFSSAFFSRGITMYTLDFILLYTQEEREKFYAEGKLLLEIDAAVTKRACERKDLVTFVVPNRDPSVMYDVYTIWAVNLPFMQTEVGNALVGTEIVSNVSNVVNVNTNVNTNTTDVPTKKYADFAFVYRWNTETESWDISLRGDNTAKLAPQCPNLATICKAYGGGGHPYAAGFTYKGNIATIIQREPVVSKVKSAIIN
jgi:oligoribonuclease NrnB/cAMP/cGMP phosphodiesterase (DHH superfamily)